MNRWGLVSCVVAAATLSACGGAHPSSTQPSPVRAEAEDDDCARRDAVRARGFWGDRFAAFCATRGSDPDLEKRMTDLLVDGGAEPRRFSVTCRADLCRVRCVIAPREQCVDDLRAVGMRAGANVVLDAILLDDRHGQRFYAFRSKEDLERLAARRALVERIARRFRASPALASCKQNASARGLLLLYIDVPASGTPSVMVDGELAYTADADRVSKALLAAVIEEEVAPPLSNRDYPIAVKLCTSAPRHFQAW